MGGKRNCTRPQSLTHAATRPVMFAPAAVAAVTEVYLINKYVYLPEASGTPNRGQIMERKEVGAWYMINNKWYQAKAGLFKTSVAFSLKAFFQHLPLNTNPALKLCLSHSNYATTARRALSTSSTSHRSRTSATYRATQRNAVSHGECTAMIHFSTRSTITTMSAMCAKMSAHSSAARWGQLVATC
jgi:hypothetical protein